MYRINQYYLLLFSLRYTVEKNFCKILIFNNLGAFCIIYIIIEILFLPLVLILILLRRLLGLLSRQLIL